MGNICKQAACVPGVGTKKEGHSSVCSHPCLSSESPTAPCGVGFQGFGGGLLTYTHITEASAWNPTKMASLLWLKCQRTDP